MKRFASVLLAVAALALLPTAVWADVQVYIPGSAGVGSAINSDGFFVAHNTFGLFGANAWVADFQLSADGTGYSDAGLILGLDGGFTLGQIQSVSVVSTGSNLAINLWLDTGGNGKFFSIVDATGLFTGLDGDSYAGCGSPTLTTTSDCYMLGGVGAGGSHTLADLQAGLVPGIGGNTPAALWIGVTNDGNHPQSANISSITVNTAAPVPEPGSVVLLGTIAGLIVTTRRRFRKC